MSANVKRTGGIFGVAAVVLFLSFIMLLAFVTFSGTRSETWGGFANGQSGAWVRYEHGWPWKFCERIVSLEAANRLLFWNGQGTIQWPPLLADCVCLLLVATMAAAGLRRFQSAPRFRLPILLCVLTAIAIPLATLSQQITRGRAETELGLWLEARGVTVEYSYNGPLWLARLTGEQFPLDDKCLVVRAIRIHGDLPSPSSRFHVYLDETSSLRELDLRQSAIDNQQLSALLSLPMSACLSRLLLDDTSITDEGLKDISNCRCLEHISFFPHISE